MLTMTALAVQSWALYAVATSLVVCRIISRRLTLHAWKKLQTDDWVMALVLVPFTAAIVFANQMSGVQSVADRKLRYQLEVLQIVVIWLVKACLLVLYWRIFPVESEFWKRRTLQGLSIFCCISFLAVQLSLITWCQPVEEYWNATTTNSQCASYHGHTVVTLIITILNTTLVMLLPIPFISSPRRFLLAVLLFLGTLVLAAGVVSRVYILVEPTSTTYLYWYTSESTLSIILANLPFLTSLATSAAPGRLRNMSRSFRTSSLPFHQWPRSQRETWASDVHRPLRLNRLNSTGTILSDLASPVDTEKTYSWGKPDARHSGNSSHQSVVEDIVPPPFSLPRSSLIPRSRLSGGLAEMGDISMGHTDACPMYWR